MTAWRKVGLILRPSGAWPWWRTHATAPTPVQLESGLWRVFVNGRDDQNRSHVAWFDVDLDGAPRCVRVSQEPLLAPGPLGHFDGNGIYVTSAVHLSAERLRFYTIGWNPGHRAPLFYAAIGVAESADMGRTIEWRSTAPILDRSQDDPMCVTAPWVLRDGERFRMWYVSGVRWEDRPEGLKSVYRVKSAVSVDGLSWERGDVAIDFQEPAESNLARPCVVRRECGYEAWFSYERGAGYRIGYATSSDGVVFRRQTHDAPIIEPSDQPYENEAVCHPAVVIHRGVRFMFYNGNRFGIDGVALAVETA